LERTGFSRYAKQREETNIFFRNCVNLFSDPDAFRSERLVTAEVEAKKGQDALIKTISFR
jgi:hypothetical protein